MDVMSGSKDWHGHLGLSFLMTSERDIFFVTILDVLNKIIKGQGNRQWLDLHVTYSKSYLAHE